MYFSGQHGSLSIGAANRNDWSEVGRIRNWSFSSQQSPLDTTCMMDYDKTIIPGVRSSTGQGTLLYYEPEDDKQSNLDKISQYIIGTSTYSAFANEDFGATSAPPPGLLRIELKLNNGRSSRARVIGMYAYITSLNVTCSVGEVFSADFTWEVHGAPFQFDF